MNNELLRYYNRELAFIRHMGAEFADNYPKLAGRLKLSGEHIEDPHVSRLIEAFSLLTAQVRQKLDDSFPELTDALLGQLYPDYQAPIPSMSVIKMITESVSTTGVVLPRKSKVEAQVDGMKSCYFQTCYETKLWPLEIVSAQFQNAPFIAPKPIWLERPKSIIKLSFETELEEISMEDLGVDNLRFFLNGQAHQTYKLHELLSAHCIGLAIVKKGQLENAQYLQPRHIKSVGFNDNEQVIPYSKRTFSAYRMLVENYIFPEKFLFFELDQLNIKWPNIEDKFEIYIYLNEGSNDLEKQVTESNFMLGCTPIINLFEHELEPIKIEPCNYEYKLAVKYMDDDVAEIIQIQDVSAFDFKNNTIKVTPFYGETHPAYAEQSNMFWHIRREASSWAGGSAEHGTEVYLSLVDLHFKNFLAVDDNRSWLVKATALCSNRNLPSHMPFGTNQAKLSIPGRGDIIKKVECLLAPTTPVRADLGDASRWQLVNHLSLSHFSGKDALKILQDTLKLYDFKNTPENKTMIDNLVAIKVNSSTARINQNGRICFCSGSDIEITFANDHYSGSGIFFFSAILDRFFAQFAAINSFTRLSVKFRGQDKIYHTWPSRAGSTPLL